MTRRGEKNGDRKSFNNSEAENVRTSLTMDWGSESNLFKENDRGSKPHTEVTTDTKDEKTL